MSNVLTGPVRSHAAPQSHDYSAFTKQEAQLSQRDRAMFRVSEYFAKSLKLTQRHSN